MINDFGHKNKTYSDIIFCNSKVKPYFMKASKELLSKNVFIFLSSHSRRGLAMYA